MNGSLHLDNALIWTGDPEVPRARCLTIRGGDILTHDRLDGEARVIDAGGRVVLPGFIDAHTHLLMGGLSLGELDLSGVTSREEFENAIQRRHAELPEDAWLIAGGWSEENWSGREPPDKSWLAGAGDRPVVCRRMDIHASLVNDVVLRRLDTSHDPEGGRIIRDGQGNPTGLMVEAAAWELVNPIIPKLTIERKQEALRAAMRHYHEFGVTTVMSMEDAHDLDDVFLPIRDELTLRVCVTLMDRQWPLDLTYARAFDHTDRLSIIGFKAFTDGTLGSRTAKLFEDYADDPGNRGLLVELTKDGHLDAWARLVVEAGFSPSVHAIGDEAARLVLNAFEGLDRTKPLRVEHAQQLARDDITRFQGLVASMQPLHKADDARYVTRRLGQHRLDGFFAFKGLLDAGAILVFGSDWPVVGVDPLLGIRTAASGITLDGEVFTPQHNITIEESLKAYTSDAARALGLDRTGMLKEGWTGDLIMLDTDVWPADWDPRKLGQPDAAGKVILTVSSGEVVYDAR
ncbi:MAG: amidohydrolase [Planctomycetota bacterium]|nr:amidohydrolase [Planctomycetota bacterium]